MVQLRIYERVTQQPNGDRDPRRHPSSKFWVDVVGNHQRMTVFEADQTDYTNSYINGTRESYHTSIMVKARKLSEVLGYVDIIDIDVTAKELEIEKLEEELRAIQTRLNVLKQEKLG